jgi:hypothetical protein
LHGQFHRQHYRNRSMSRQITERRAALSLCRLKATASRAVKL